MRAPSTGHPNSNFSSRYSYCCVPLSFTSPCYQAVVARGPLVFLLSHWLAPGPSHKKPAANEPPLVISPSFCKRSVKLWSPGREWGERRIPAFFLGPSSSPGGQQVRWGAQGAGWGLCPAGLQSCHQSCPLALAQALRQQWTSPPCPPQWTRRSGSLPGLQSVRPGPIVWAAWGACGSVGSWAPGCLSDDSGAGSGNFSLRGLPTEICLLLARIEPWRGKVVTWPYPFCQTRK